MAGEKIIPIEIDLDTSPLYLGAQKGRLVRNLDYAQYGGKKDGENALVLKPLQLADKYDPGFTLPIGINFTIGEYESHETSEIYVFVYNTLKNHSIYRMSNGKCEYVFIGKELNFQLNPDHFIGKGRCTVIPFCRGTIKKTYLIWTDGINPQRFICVEDSIATKYFSSPRFQIKYREELINLGIAEPMDCIGIKEIRTDNLNVINKVKKNTWQWRISYLDVYGRPSEHGIISTLYYQNECASEQANCVDLTFDAGGPMVQSIRIEFLRNCKGEWSRYDVIHKYENCDKPWYERKINQAINYSSANNKITYRFCFDKECVMVPDVETQRTENPMPVTSESLFSLSGRIGMAGNRYKYEPFGCDILDKIKFQVENPPQEEIVNQIQTRNITVYVHIHNPYNQQSQAIWKEPDSGRIVWGGLGPDHRREPGIIVDYAQYFGDPEQEGFIGYLVGTNIATVSKQYKFNNPAGGGIGGLTQPMIADEQYYDEHGVSLDRNEVRDNKWVQKFEFKNIRPGKYIFRIAGHHSTLRQPDFHKTSTYVTGSIVISDEGGIATREVKDWSREIVIDVCEKDYNTFDIRNSNSEKRMLTIWDLTEPHKDVSLKREIRIASGYLWETNDSDKGVIPIEGARIDTNADDAVRRVWTTDHNGFYWVGAKDKNYYVRLMMNNECREEEVGRNTLTADVNLTGGVLLSGGLFNSEGNGVHGKNFFAKDKWPDFLEGKCNRILIRGKVIDCVHGGGIPNVSVVLEHGQFAVTNKRGEYEIIAHDYMADTRQRTERVFFLSNSTCAIVNCEGLPCLDTREYNQPACTDCVERIRSLADVRVKSTGLVYRGLQLGGKYAFSVKAVDWMGRKSWLQMDKQRFYLDIPTANEIGGFAYPRIRWSFDPGIRFAPDVRWLIFNYSKNLRFSDFHTWVVDRFEFIDNTGLENVISPSQIKVYYSSLNEYNKQHNFATNSTWQFIDEKDVLLTTDQVQFIANGDGEMFDTVINLPVRFDRDGSYFLIDFEPELRDLKDGALIKFIREKECAEAEIHNEVCKVVEVVNGIPVETGGYLDAFDSFFVYRHIPTPITIKKKVKKSTQNQDGSTTYEEVEESSTINIIRPYGWPFEHHSPSDFFGDKCSNRGRPGIYNEHQGIICKEDEIALSGALGQDGLLNYLHYFDERWKKQFKDKKRGSILSCIVEGNTLLAICESGHFLVPFDDDAVRVDANGIARANSGDQQFGKPVRKGPDYGCSRIDRNTIAYQNGLVHWIDAKRVAQVYHNFSVGMDISEKKFKSFLTSKIKYLQGIAGAVKGVYLHSRFNPKDRKCYTTHFNLGIDQYTVINERKINIDSNETWAVDVETQSLRMFCSFTPELYAALPGERGDEQFFSFVHGVPYKHYRPAPTLFNNFYGKQCNHHIKIVALFEDQFKVKGYMALATYVDDVKLWAPEVVTEHGQLSRIPRNWFQRGHKFWVAPFLCATNSTPDPNFGKERAENILFGGDRLFGRWAEVLFEGDPDNLGKYFEITGFIVNANGVEKTGV